MYLAALKQAWFNAVNTRRLFVMIFLSQFVGMCFALVKPVFEGNFFNALQIGGSDIWKISSFWLSLLVLTHFIHVTLWHYSHCLADKVSFDIRKNSTCKYYDIYTKLPMDWHIGHHSGETMGRINQAVDGISKFPGHQPKTIRFVMNFFGQIILLCLYSWQVALITSVAYSDLCLATV